VGVIIKVFIVLEEESPNLRQPYKFGQRYAASEELNRLEN
jgi:hypothetical protein